MISNDTTPVKRISPGDLRDLIHAQLSKQHEEVGIIGEPQAATEFATALYKLWAHPADATWPNLSDEDIACALGYVADAFAAIAERLTIERETREDAR